MAPKPKGKKRLLDYPDRLIENIATASKNAQKIYFIYFILLAYCVITVLGTSDRQIILNETTHLPLLNVFVSFNGFFILSPLIAIFVFVYFQLYLSRIKNLRADLDAKYPKVDKKYLYPWIINIAEYPDPGTIGKLQKMIVKFSLWYALPIVLFLISVWFIKKHEPILSYFIAAIPILATFLVIWFWYKYESVPGQFRFNLSWFRTFIRENPGKVGLAFAACIFGLYMLLFIIPVSNRGEGISVDLSAQKLVNEPNVDYPTIYWLFLRKVHLEGANLTYTVLKRTDLRGAYLLKAKLFGAVLTGTNFAGADLRQTNLSHSNLEEANLYRANLQGADLNGANLSGAYLDEANLQGANLGFANLDRADLTASNLEGVKLYHSSLIKARLPGIELQGDDFRGNNFQEAMLFNAKFQGADLSFSKFVGADLDNVNFQEARLFLVNFSKASLFQANFYKAELRQAEFQESDAQWVNFSDANLTDATFEGALLFRSNFQRANLEGTNLDKAALAGADLRKVRNLTLSQICRVKTLYNAKLDIKLEKQIKESCPHLLEKY